MISATTLPIVIQRVMTRSVPPPSAMGMEYYLEERPITRNTYEKGLNDKTSEFYLDTPKEEIDNTNKDVCYNL
jgi:hypothetical protein